MKSIRIGLAAVPVLAVTALFGIPASAQGMNASPVKSQPSPNSHISLNCAVSRLCPDVAESDEVFGHYVGHDEPSALFYSRKPGRGNRMQYTLRLPRDPSPARPDTNSYHFELNPTFWF